MTKTHPRLSIRPGLAASVLALGLLFTMHGHARAWSDTDPNTLFGSEQLLDLGQSLSPSCGLRLEMQTDGNLVLYYFDTPLWATNTVGIGRIARMQADGNFVVYDGNMRPVFATGTAGHPGAYLVLQTDRNLVVYDKNNVPLWATGTWAVPVVAPKFPPGWLCVEHAEKTEVRPSRDIPGNSYLIVRQGANEGVYFCSTRCQNDSACVAYSYEASSQLCSLKDFYSTSASKRGFTSGRVLRKTLSVRNPPKPR